MPRKQRFIALAALIVLASPAMALERLEDLDIPKPRSATAQEQAAFNEAMKAMISGNTDVARQQLTPLAAAGITTAQVALAGLASQAGEGEAALKWTYFAARAGDWQAQAALADAYREGRYLPRDFYQALIWMDRAAAEGGKALQAELAHLSREAYDAAEEHLNNGEYKQAERLLEPVAQLGMTRAQETLAQIYEQGLLGETQTGKARDWYAKAAEQGSRSAQYALALSYLDDPELNNENREKAISLLRQAADPGQAEAQYRLGVLYLSGWVTDEDASRGIFWYRMAAEQGHVKAQYALGVHYVLGDTVQRDDHEAHRWFKHAAEQGLPKAQHNLALTYLHGLGTQKAPEKAQTWFQKAAMNGVTKSVAFLKQMDAPLPPPPEKSSKKGSAGSSKPTKRKALAGEDWFRNLPETGYTLQVISSRRDRSVDDFLQNNGLAKGDFFHYVWRAPDGPWHIVQYGYYPDLKAARAAANKISGGYKRFKPWIRQVKSIKKQFNG